MALTDLTRISTSGIATGSTIDAAILRKDVSFRGSQVGVQTALFDASDDELKFQPNAKLSFSGTALQIYHGSNVSHIAENGTGPLRLSTDEFQVMNSAQNKTMIYAAQNLAVSLNYNGNTKIETTNHGAVVTGILTASSFSGPIGNPSGISTFYDLKVTNNLTVEGTTTTLDTNLIGVDRIEVGANSNSIVGVAITQSGTADIVNLFDGTTEVLTVVDGGTVGINSSSPDTQFKLDAVGSGIFTREGTFTSTDFNKGQFTVRNITASQGAFLDFRAASSNGARGVIAKIGGFNTKTGSGYDGELTFSTRQNSDNTMVERLRINSAGSVGIGSAIPAQTLDIMSANPVIRLTDTDPAGVYSQIDGAGGDLILAADGGGGSSSSFISFRVDGTALSAEKVRIDSDGRLLLNHDSSRSIGNITAQVQLEGTTANASAISITRNSLSEYPPYLNFGKSRATSTGGTTIINNNDNLGEIRFSGADGNDLTNYAASINAEVDGTPGNNVTPGRLIFSTTSSTGSDAIERLRITSSGIVGINSTSPSGAQLVVQNSDDSNLNTINIINDNGNMSASLSQDSSGAGSYLQKDNAGNIKTFIRSYGTSYFLGGNIGIGTNSISQPLTIRRSSAGQGEFGVRLEYNNQTGPTNTSSALLVGSYGLKFKNYNSNRDFLFETGKVGIGTVDPDHNLHVHSSSGDSVITIESTGNGSHSALEFVRTQSGGDSKGAGSIYVTGNTGGSEAVMNFGVGHNISYGTVPRLSIKGDGEVGIGTENPSTMLHIKSTFPTLLVEGTNDTVGYTVSKVEVRAFYYRKAGFTISGDNGTEDIFIGRPYASGNTTAPLVFNFQGTEQVRIKSDGKVGIGTDQLTTDAKLDIWGDGSAYPTLRLGTEVYDTEGEDIRFGRTDIGGSDIRYHSIRTYHHADNSSNYMKFDLHDGGSAPYQSQNTVLFLRGDNKVGIAYDSPRTALEVRADHITTADTVTPVLRLSTGNSYAGSNTGSALEFGTTNTSYPSWVKGRIGCVYNGSSSYGGHLVFQTNSGSSATALSEKMRLTDDGILSTTCSSDSVFKFNIDDSIGWWNTNTGLAPNTTRTWTITGIHYGGARILIGGGDGNYQRAGAVIEVVGTMWANNKSYYHNETIKNSSGASISTTYNNDSIEISVSSSSNWWYYSMTVESHRRTSGSFPTVTVS